MFHVEHRETPSRAASLLIDAPQGIIGHASARMVEPTEHEVLPVGPGRWSGGD